MAAHPTHGFVATRPSVQEALTLRRDHRKLCLRQSREMSRRLVFDPFEQWAEFLDQQMNADRLSWYDPLASKAKRIVVGQANLVESVQAGALGNDGRLESDVRIAVMLGEPDRVGWLVGGDQGAYDLARQG
jgi:hypothetical protein